MNNSDAVKRVDEVVNKGHLSKIRDGVFYIEDSIGVNAELTILEIRIILSALESSQRENEMLRSAIEDLPDDVEIHRIIKGCRGKTHAALATFIGARIRLAEKALKGSSS